MMTVERAETLHNELCRIKYDALGCISDDPEFYNLICRCAQVIDEILAYMPKEPDEMKGENV